MNADRLLQPRVGVFLAGLLFARRQVVDHRGGLDHLRLLFVPRLQLGEWCERGPLLLRCGLVCGNGNARGPCEGGGDAKRHDEHCPPTLGPPWRD